MLCFDDDGVTHHHRHRLCSEKTAYLATDAPPKLFAHIRQLQSLIDAALTAVGQVWVFFCSVFHPFLVYLTFG